VPPPPNPLNMPQTDRQTDRQTGDALLQTVGRGGWLLCSAPPPSGGKGCIAAYPWRGRSKPRCGYRNATATLPGLISQPPRGHGPHPVAAWE
jgi:hypothetical protein